MQLQSIPIPTVFQIENPSFAVKGKFYIRKCITFLFSFSRKMKANDKLNWLSSFC